jgi:hypothetical protein
LPAVAFNRVTGARNFGTAQCCTAPLSHRQSNDAAECRRTSNNYPAACRPPMRTSSQTASAGAFNARPRPASDANACGCINFPAKIVVSKEPSCLQASLSGVWISDNNKRKCHGAETTTVCWFLSLRDGIYCRPKVCESDIQRFRLGLNRHKRHTLSVSHRRLAVSLGEAVP